jgi:hypothetical protein
MVTDVTITNTDSMSEDTVPTKEDDQWRPRSDRMITFNKEFSRTDNVGRTLSRNSPDKKEPDGATTDLPVPTNPELAMLDSPCMVINMRANLPAQWDLDEVQQVRNDSITRAATRINPAETPFRETFEHWDQSYAQEVIM